MVMFAFTYADMLIAESALSFLGLGLPLTAASWGNMLFGKPPVPGRRPPG